MSDHPPGSPAHEPAAPASAAPGRPGPVHPPVPARATSDEQTGYSGPPPTGPPPPGRPYLAPPPAAAHAAPVPATDGPARVPGTGTARIAAGIGILQAAITLLATVGLVAATLDTHYTYTADAEALLVVAATGQSIGVLLLVGGAVWLHRLRTRVAYVVAMILQLALCLYWFLIAVTSHPVTAAEYDSRSTVLLGAVLIALLPALGLVLAGQRQVAAGLRARRVAAGPPASE